MSNKKSLKPFKKGNDPRRNLKGRTDKGIVTDIKEYIRQKLAEPASQGSNDTRLDALTAKLLQKAYNGEIKALELCMAYGWGKPSQQIDVSGNMQITTIKVVRE